LEVTARLQQMEGDARAAKLGSLEALTALEESLHKTTALFEQSKTETLKERAKVGKVQQSLEKLHTTLKDERVRRVTIKTVEVSEPGNTVLFFRLEK